MDMGSSSLGSTSGSSDLLNGLKFGQKIYFEDVGSVVNSSPPPAATALASAPSSELNSSSSKKGRGVSATPRCQVEGCNADLTGSKAYYCRHKVCGMHSKSPKVIVTGLEQRFCQQCSRFHLLAEFDQRKRSCRRRLAGHNERRRKPPPGSLLSSRYFHASSSIQDASSLRGFWDFPYSRCPKRDVWPPSRNVNYVPRNEVTSSGKFLSNLCQGNFDTCSVNDSTHMAQPHLQSLFGGPSMPCSETQAGERFAGVSDSACALSLLSTQQWDPRNGSSGFNNYMNSEIALRFQPISNVSTNTTSNVWSLKSYGDSGNSEHLDFQQFHCSINGNHLQTIRNKRAGWKAAHESWTI